MPDYLEVSADILSLTVTENLIGGSNTPIEMKLGGLREQQKKGRADLRQLESRLDGLYQRAVSELDASHGTLAEVADILLQKERAAAELLLPGIETLRRNLASRPDLKGSDFQETFEESLRIAQRWLTLYSETRAKILALAENPKGASKKTLRTKPMKNETDWGELSREHIARYPKIRARLAE
jgi:hypothetical protein